MRAPIFNFLFLLMILSCNREIQQAVSYKYPESLELQCKSDPRHRYHYSKAETGGDSLLLIVAIDAHADGRMAVNKIAQACDFMPALIVASDLIQNNFPGYEAAIDELIVDARTRFGNLRKDVILAGFSGGARMAQAYALKRKVQGLLMFGAGPWPNIPPCPFSAAVGTEDFNFLELYQRPTLEQLSDADHLVDYFRGPHEWPPSEAIRDGLLFVCGTMSENVIRAYEKRSHQLEARADSLRGNALFGWKCLQKAYQFSVDTEERENLKRRAGEFLADPVLEQALSKLEETFKEEVDNRKYYVDMTSSAPLAFWKDEIKRVEECAMLSSSTYKIDECKRLKAFMGIMFYSRLNSLLQSDGDLDQIGTLCRAFGILEPDNADMLHFKSEYFSRMNMGDSAGYYMDRASKEGL